MCCLGIPDRAQRSHRAHEVVGVLKKIGGPEILSGQKKLGSRMSSEFSIQMEKLNSLKKLVIVTLVCSIGTLAASIYIFLSSR